MWLIECFDLILHWYANLFKSIVWHLKSTAKKNLNSNISNFQLKKKLSRLLCFSERPEIEYSNLSKAKILIMESLVQFILCVRRNKDTSFKMCRKWKYNNWWQKNVCIKVVHAFSFQIEQCEDNLQINNGSLLVFFLNGVLTRCMGIKYCIGHPHLFVDDVWCLGLRSKKKIKIWTFQSSVAP